MHYFENLNEPKAVELAPYTAFNQFAKLNNAKNIYKYLSAYSVMNYFKPTGIYILVILIKKTLVDINIKSDSELKINFVITILVFYGLGG